MTDVVTLHKELPVSKPGFCPTPTARTITNLLAVCQAHSLIGVIVGDPGTGKSTAIGEFADSRRGAVFQCRMTKAAAKLQPGLVRIAEALRVYVAPNAGANDIYQEIGRNLRGGMARMLILDEAQHMEDELLEAVRDLYDEFKIGIALVGNFGLTDRWSDRSNKRKYSNFAQLRGRLGPQVELTKPLSEDIEALCTHHQIAGKQACSLIARAAGMPGGLHNVANLMRVADQLAGGQAVAFRHLEDAALITGVK